MKKIVRLTENDLVKLIKRVINEQVDISKYEGSKTDPMDDSDIEITKYEEEFKGKPLSKTSPIYKKIKSYFETKYPVSVIGIEESINKTMEPIYKVHFPSMNPNLESQTFEITIEDIDTDKPTLRKRFEMLLNKIDKTKKFEKTYRA